ncbi:DNA mismatch repair endonuclease MutH [Shewanella schlegeliana]|uniref:DNA mismatch repair protein MutH n=1 Tax=Shewanella schlegeliana TaxID=190308 RepID=A0ABS1SVZ7_9GAMM|nr:DNA mismatch repair endonuclease MutH [Shewanella schlegeliana]MBL4912200.1 DNA mismatch repair endonuclease MutH [Shewanella schlegeliana]MCL1110714.1 DNA mismatch repair endonuclease MutH [Shewanella schlegeliana]GIU22654.1 DNA mismatch repair protein MutH [Shewanella schlegeliana]
MKKSLHSPNSIEELMLRAESMAGLTLGQLANFHEIQIPKDLKRHKGWVGQLIELELGALAGSKPEQDFAHLGIELKTIPVSALGKVLETTYVTVAPLTNIQGLTWEESVVCHKLQQILWIPVQGDRDIPLSLRQIGSPILWRPSAEESAQLKQDWEEIMEFISMGQVDKVTARHGEVLQLRPKAANSQVLTDSIGRDGKLTQTNPRGFYLKTQFTQRILSQLL